MSIEPGSVVKALQKIVGAKQDGAIGSKTLQATANFDASETIVKFHSIWKKLQEGLVHLKLFWQTLDTLIMKLI